MIEGLGELFRHKGSGVERAAVVSDVRGGEYFDGLLAVLDGPRRRRPEADRPLPRGRRGDPARPLQGDPPPPPAGAGRSGSSRGSEAERELLAPLRERADMVMDTSDLTGAELRRRIAEEMLDGEDGGKLALTLLTFGFKNGPPRDADLTLDVRFLPNPHYVDELRPLTGMDEEVRAYVESGHPGGRVLRPADAPARSSWSPPMSPRARATLTIAVGCTGGRHRSVTVADRIRRDLADLEGVIVKVKHRDLTDSETPCSVLGRPNSAAIRSPCVLA